MRLALLLVAGTSLVVGIARIAIVLANPTYFSSAAGGDLDWQMQATYRWLAGDTWYMPYQLSGPYYNQSGNLYPVVVVPLYLAFTVLPHVLWWVIPIGVMVAFLIWTRPTPWGRALIAACLTLPAISIVHLINGNTTMWVAMLIALGYRWPWVTALIAPFKPSLFPFAFLGIRSKSWWVAATVLVAVNIPLIPVWLEYVQVLRNAYGEQVNPFYAARDLPMLAVPFIAWATRTNARGPSPAAQRHLLGGIVPAGIRHRVATWRAG
jgi:hypothetical protein